MSLRRHVHHISASNLAKNLKPHLSPAGVITVVTSQGEMIEDNDLTPVDQLIKIRPKRQDWADKPKPRVQTIIEEDEDELDLKTSRRANTPPSFASTSVVLQSTKRTSKESVSLSPSSQMSETVSPTSSSTVTREDKRKSPTSRTSSDNNSISPTSRSSGPVSPISPQRSSSIVRSPSISRSQRKSIKYDEIKWDENELKKAGIFKFQNNPKLIQAYLHQSFKQNPWLLEATPHGIIRCWIQKSSNELVHENWACVDGKWTQLNNKQFADLKQMEDFPKNIQAGKVADLVNKLENKAAFDELIALDKNKEYYSTVNMTSEVYKKKEAFFSTANMTPEAYEEAKKSIKSSSDASEVYGHPLIFKQDTTLGDIRANLDDPGLCVLKESPGGIITMYSYLPEEKNFKIVTYGLAGEKWQKIDEWKADNKEQQAKVPNNIVTDVAKIKENLEALIKKVNAEEKVYPIEAPSKLSKRDSNVKNPVPTLGPRRS